ncbi:MAG: PDZ domain-containing protein, partial [Akkermansiaceae bacterium]|nr:PDZ domain-containing protein [Akkermansiaceae bacterium]
MADLSTIEASPDALAAPAPRRSRWAIAAAALLLAGFVLILLASVKVPYLATSPGPVLEVQGIVEVADVPSFEGEGELFLLTISRGSDPLTLFEWFEAWRDPAVDLVERDLVIPEGTTSDERRRRNLEVMEGSQQLAVAVALDRLGYEVGVVGNGAYITEVTAGGPADGIAQPDDIVVAFDGMPVEFVQDLIDAVRGSEIGANATLTVDRAGELEDIVIALG